MIQFEEAHALSLSRAIAGGTERVSLAECTGRVLAEEISSDLDMPPFNKSSMDGFACRRVDLGMPLRVIETIPAGIPPGMDISEGTCSRIMTGGMIPSGADTVIKVEDTEEDAEGLVRFTGKDTKSNICLRGEDIAEGQVVIKSGMLISSRHIPTLASAGSHQPLVCKRPKVGIISTGTELVEPWEKPGPGQIRNSNGHQLMAQAGSCGALCTYYGIVDDTAENTVDRIREALENNDIILMSGGVSMGDFDLVPAMLGKAGMEILFRQISIQPGKPTLFAQGGGKFCFALPGNPVSSFVLFEMLVRPFLYKMQGHDYIPGLLHGRMAETYSRKKTSRMALVPVKVENGEIFPAEYHGSAHIHALVNANGLITLKPGLSGLEKGETTDVRLI